MTTQQIGNLLEEFMGAWSRFRSAAEAELERAVMTKGSHLALLRDRYAVVALAGTLDTGELPR